MTKTLTAVAAVMFAAALSAPALAQTDHMSTGNTTGAMSSGEHMTKGAKASGDHMSTGAMSSGEHMSTGAMASGDHMSTGKKGHKAAKKAAKKDAMSTGAMSH